MNTLFAEKLTGQFYFTRWFLISKVYISNINTSLWKPMGGQVELR